MIYDFVGVVAIVVLAVSLVPFLAAISIKIVDFFYFHVILAKAMCFTVKMCLFVLTLLFAVAMFIVQRAVYIVRLQRHGVFLPFAGITVIYSEVYTQRKTLRLINISMAFPVVCTRVTY